MDPKEIFRRALNLLVQKRLPPTPVHYAHAYRVSEAPNPIDGEGLSQSELVLFNKLLDVLRPAFSKEEGMQTDLKNLQNLIYGPAPITQKLAYADQLVSDLARTSLDAVRDKQRITDALQQTIASLYSELQDAMAATQGSEDRMPLYESRINACQSVGGAVDILRDVTEDVRVLAKSLRSSNNAVLAAQRSLAAAKSELSSAYATVEQVTADAASDPLTGILNRRGLEARLESMPIGHLSLLTLDLDNFKRINDTLGHPVGDIVIQGLASVLQKISRKEDAVARLGGEEFCIVMHSVSHRDAENIARRVLVELREWSALEFERKHGTPITVSGGLARWYSNGKNCTEQFKNAMAIADKQLYKAKKAGKNCVVSDNEVI